jgi:hypothetical protein
MNLKRSIRKSTRIAIACGNAVDIWPIVLENAPHAPAGPHRDNGAATIPLRIAGTTNR